MDLSVFYQIHKEYNLIYFPLHKNNNCGVYREKKNLYRSRLHLRFLSLVQHLQSRAALFIILVKATYILCQRCASYSSVSGVVFHEIIIKNPCLTVLSRIHMYYVYIPLTLYLCLIYVHIFEVYIATTHHLTHTKAIFLLKIERLWSVGFLQQ